MRSVAEYAQSAYHLVDEATVFRNIIAMQTTPAPQAVPQSAVEPQIIEALHASYALQLSIDKLQSDLSVLKFGVDAGTRSTNWQFDQIEERLDRIDYLRAEPAAKIARTIERLDRVEQAQAEPAAKIARTIERLDRIEQAQAEPAAKIARTTERLDRVELAQAEPAAKIARTIERLDRIEQAQAEPAARIARTIERLDRLERRVDAIVDPDSTGSIGPGSITTGSVTPTSSAPTPTPRPQAAKAPARPQRLPVLGGWVVREVLGNTAFIRDNNLSTITVTPGATIPGTWPRRRDPPAERSLGGGHRAGPHCFRALSPHRSRLTALPAA